MKLTTTQIAISGEFAVLSQLALRGFDANLTLGNTKGVDILASNPKSGSLYRIEVKTTMTKASKGKGMWGPNFSWSMQSKHDQIDDPKLFFVFTVIEETGKDYRFFVVPSKFVGDYCYQEHKHWVKYREEKKGAQLRDTDRRSFRVGLGEFEYPIKTILSNECEDNWGILK